MAQERTVRPMGAFFKFTRIGQWAAGKVARGNETENGPFIVFEPVLIHAEDGPPRMYESAAIGLSTDLSLKIDYKLDVGNLLLIEFADTEPTKKGSPKKVFRVSVLTPAELTNLAVGADGSNRHTAYVAPGTQTTPGALQDEPDEFPF